MSALKDLPTTLPKQRHAVTVVLRILDNAIMHEAKFGGGAGGQMNRLVLMRSALRDVLQQMRKRPSERGRNWAKKVGLSTKAKVIAMRAQFPKDKLSDQEIATACKVSNGRVSEILHGKRQ